MDIPIEIHVFEYARKLSGEMTNYLIQAICPSVIVVESRTWRGRKAVLILLHAIPTFNNTEEEGF